MRDRLHTAPVQFACGSCSSIEGRLPWHRCWAPLSCQHHHCQRRRKHSAGRTAAQVAWRLAWPSTSIFGSTARRETLRRPATSTLAPCATCAAFSPTTSPKQSLSRLDYCNALLCGAPTTTTTFDKLQRAHNNLARVTVCHCRLPRSLWSLHWLPVKQRVIYKIIGGFYLRPG